jgi:hyaluronan synthase/N-acetylglucosaminyltransferase
VSILGIYGIFALGHLFIQLIFGMADSFRQHRTSWKEEFTDYQPNVWVIVPVYNEDPYVLERCLRSIYRQKYKQLKIVVVDDGSVNVAEHEKTYAKFNGGRLKVIEEAINCGKRHAQKVGFDAVKADPRFPAKVVVTVDSDTILRDRHAIRTLVQRFRDPQVGAVTGDVRVENASVNLLTRLISCRYWMAFHQERAAQSLFGVMMCCSGPFAAYRASELEAVEDEYVTQRFLGRLCTFGDDRHLTNLFLRRGNKVVFEDKARAFTHVPEDLKQYLSQQLRWSKSFYREATVTVRFMRHRHPYLAVDLILQLVLPFMLMGALGSVVVRSITQSAGLLWHYALIVLAISFIRCLYGMIRNRDWKYMLFTGYGLFVHIPLLIPIRLVALATLGRTHWGTRNIEGFEQQYN